MALLTWVCAALLGCTLQCNAQPVVVQHNCDLESGLCGWEYYSSNDLRQTGVVQPSNASALRLGPKRDENPGTENGHYYYFYYPHDLDNANTLVFPNYQYICNLSFAYAVDGATTPGVRRWNYDHVDINTAPAAAGAWNITGPWQRAYLNFTVPIVNRIYPLYFYESLADMGEAVPTDLEIFLALDDINITFCLPCNFDNLTAKGNMVLNVPDEVPVLIGELTNTSMSATSSICPNATFIYTIESVFPAQLAPIFTLDPYSGVLSVDASGPYLDANGTAGNITISAYILGSNYTNLSPPFKVYRTARFYQGPVISVWSPPNITITVGVPFFLLINATSPLDYTMPLLYLLISSQPPTLADYIVNYDPRFGNGSGLITVQQLASVLSPSNTPPALMFNITNQYYSNVLWTVQLLFAPSPPLFTQQDYSFFVQPNSGVIPIGTLTVIDPHQRQLQAPWLTLHDSSDFSLFQLVCVGSINCTLLWRQSPSNQYKSSYSFAITTYPIASPSLIASANISVGLYPINAYIPVVTPQSVAIRTVDTAPAATPLLNFSAQDNDTGLAGVVTFSLGSGNVGGFFSISPSGALVVAITPLYPTTYQLIVLASDGGTPTLVGRAYVSITVVATQSVNCSNTNYYSPPVITSPASDNLYTTVGANLTVVCSVPASTLPMVLTRWTVLPLPSSNQPSYHTAGSSVVLTSVTDNDTGVYICSVSNQCGNATRGYILNVLDFPNPPAQVGIPTGVAYPTNVTISWVYVASSYSPQVSTSVDHFVVELRTTGNTYFSAVANASSDATRATITGLIPYSTNYIRVSAVNGAGSTPSKVLTIATPTSVPQLSYLNVTALGNQSLLVSWKLQYDGGWPVTSLNITVEALDSSPAPVRAIGKPAPVTYSLSMSTSYLLTTSFPQGWVYLVTAYVQNKVGTSSLDTRAFVGSSYNIVCSYESPSCPWTLLDGQRITAGNGGPLQPPVDADGQANGHYWSLKATTPLNNWRVLSYPSAGWLCGFSFDYFHCGSINLTLQTMAGEVLWSGVQDASAVGTNWNHAVSDGKWMVPDVSRDGLVFVVNSLGNQSTVALDNIMLTFCAPCSLQQLQNAIRIIPQNITVYLRTQSNVSLQTSVSSECSAVVLQYGISGVDPLCVQSSFTVPDTSYGIIHVGVISPLTASPGTRGALEVSVSVVGSDFRRGAVTQAASLGLVLEDLTGQCANTLYCDFSLGTCQWLLGPNISTVMDSSSQMTGYYAHGYASRASQVVLSTAISDDYCGISFGYMLTQSQMDITVQGLGVIWSADTSSTWAFQSVPIDITSVGVWSGRVLSFEVYGSSNVPMGSMFGVGNITLVPCTDCAATDCHCITCMPGSYFSIKQDKCITCPLGYYCSELLDLPQPCPAGTYNPVTMVTSLSGCLTCPKNYYSFMGQSACKSCPNGFSCSDPANPIANASTAAGTIAATVSSVIIAAFLVVGIVMCLYCCYCIRKSRQERMKERAKYLNSRWNTQVTEQSVVNTPDVLGQKRKTLDQMAMQENVLVYSNVLYEGDDASMSSIPAAVLHSTPALPQLKDADGEEAEEVDLIELKEWGTHRR